MKRAAIPLLIACCAVVAWTQQRTPFDGVLEALRAELIRARAISLPDQQPPYFVQYLARATSSFSATAASGALISRRLDGEFRPEVQVRVGDYGFDGAGEAGTEAASHTAAGVAAGPVSDDYNLLRRYLWLSTDAAYRSAIDAFSRKRAAPRTGGAAGGDFSRAATLNRILPPPGVQIDTELWCERVRTISALLAKYPELKDSAVEVESLTGVFTLVNSEGTEVREPEAVSRLRMYAVAQAPDGMVVSDEATFLARDPFHLPAELETARAVKTVAQNTIALARAPRGEEYSGPVLFEGTAGAQVFAEALGPALTGDESEMRIGARVLPAFFDVVDDPTQIEWRGRFLFGSYGVDHDGVIPTPLRVIEKGVLKTYLTTRRPVPGGGPSNGRSRLPRGGAGMSNVFVRASETVPVEQLKKKLLALCAERGKPYGVIVHKMAFGRQGAPLLAYRVSSDGREELIRGVSVRSLGAPLLSHILAAGDDTAVFEFVNGSGPVAANTVVVASSILVDGVELRPAPVAFDKAPALPPPHISK